MAVKLAPSLLAADHARLGEAARWAEEGGADLLHVDVMDGHFVHAVTFGDGMVKGLRTATGLELDVHLMVSDPLSQVPRYLAAGAQRVTFHVEAVTEGQGRGLAGSIRKAGAAAGVALNPITRVEELAPYVGHVDQVMVMTVVPGAGGQALIEETLAKFARLRAMFGPDVVLVADGGVKQANVARVAAAGATVLVAGSAVYDKDYTAQSVEAAIAALRETL
jgi:ribulose-phosphate 3-epimerase